MSKPAEVNSAETDALVQIEHERVLSVLSELPGRQREVLVLRYYGQLSEAEIADTLGISKLSRQRLWWQWFSAGSQQF